MQNENNIKSLWNGALAKYPNASFFQTPEWYSIWEEYLVSNLEVLQTHEGFFLPTIRLSRNWGIHEFHAAPRGTMMFCFDKKGQFQIPRTIPKNCYLRSPQKIAGVLGREEQSMQIDLGKEFSFTKHHDRALRRAQSLEMQVYAVENLKEWDDFYTIYKEAHSRWKKKEVSYTRELLHIIHRQDIGLRKLWLVKHKEQIVAGALCFYFGSRVDYWLGATDYTFKQLNAGHALHYEIITHAKTQKYLKYNMGNSAGIAGVEAFKKGFGAEAQANYFYYNETVPLRILNRISRFGKL